MATSFGLKALRVRNFKSIGAEEQRLEIRPLTILAGANSSGKSSLIQPLLLIKQTLESDFDPGALLLSGRHIFQPSAEQFLSQVPGADRSGFQFGFDLGPAKESPEAPQGNLSIDLQFQYSKTNQSLDITHSRAAGVTEEYESRTPYESLIQLLQPPPYAPLRRVALGVRHVPGLRGNRQRYYPRALSRPPFKGTFDQYVPSIIHEWQKERRLAYIEQLERWLNDLGLTAGISVELVNDAELDIRVSRLLDSKSQHTRDYLSIADVGFGVSQILPALVALIDASAGDTIYIEQPELHLHPRAQVAFARILPLVEFLDYNIILETHSSLIIREIQTLIAQQMLDPSGVSLNWFKRDPVTMGTVVARAEIDEMGRYGTWPTDFDDIALESEGRFLDAVASRRNG